MIVCVAMCECRIDHAHSLKDKRAVLQRVMTRLKQKYNVSVSEIDYQDTWQRTQIAIAIVSSSRISCEREIQHSLQFIDSFPELERTITDLEWL